MRGVESLMLVVLVGLLGLGLWQGRNWLPDLGWHTRSAVMAASAAKTANEQKPKSSLSAGHGRSKAAQSHELTGGARERENTENSIVVEVPFQANPNVGDLPLGTTRAALRQQYGEPMLDVTARREGRLVERYYYMAKDQGRLTVATLQDGKVVSTEAVSY